MGTRTPGCRSKISWHRRQASDPSSRRRFHDTPVDVGEGLVVEGEAAEEDLGALLDFGVVTAYLTPLGLRVFRLIVKRHICFSLKLGDEGFGGVADGGEDGGVGDEMLFVRISIDTADIVVEISRGSGNASNVRLKFLIS
ncbi:uncharacterized protein BcabD6B2_07850 [Babesia caballi]|uniref:Uncharacterized protein n=1 Tax=Babesia caballi TaxID=5871 RepID=A0AAV4LPD3_BABCB|nr:hypothetical protein, conserved [Babesia caballi]